MTTTINASPTNGIVQTADGSGIVKLQSNGVATNALAWGNYLYNGAAAPTLRSAYNVSSITRNSTGLYTVNLTGALSDANYTLVFQAQFVTYAYSTSAYASAYIITSKTTTSFQISTAYVSNASGSANVAYDNGFDFVIFGN